MAATVADAEPDASAAAGPPAAVPAAAATAVAAPAAGQDRASAALASGNGLTVFGVFVAFGLLLSFTPCVLPMLPILSSIIVGQGQATSRARGFSLALSYSLGMALVYTAMGMLAGWLGQGLAGALQQPWVLSGFALVLVAFSLSMFGVWEFQAPAFIQERLSSASGLMRGGNYLGVFVMGSLSALICGPCVAPPLAGVLVYISQAHDFVLGGLALFALATGMSVPLLLLGVSAGRLLPRAGAWMERVKIVFGILLMATALWLVAPVMPTSATMAILGAALLFGAGLLFWSADRPAAWARAAVVPVAVLGSIYLVGALSGGQDMLHPLARTASDNPAATLKTAQSDFIKVRSEEEFAAAIGRAQGRTIVVDYYADWCVSCKEMEHLTFADAAVQEKLRQALLLRVDVTEDNPASRSLLKRFGLFGPPGIVFLDAQGREKTHELRVIGYMNSEQFLLKLAGAGLS
jgi:thiol:disulfide interchange protein DsbD